MKNNLYWHSYFADCRQKQSTSISLEEFFQRITTGFYRRDAELYRQLIDEGKLKEAAALKNRQPAITVSGQFEGGHSAACQVSMSGCMAADIDHTNERTGEFMQQLCALPYVAGCMRSFSGKGIKCFVRIDALTQDEYRTAYACVIARIESLLQFACDKQCKDVSRLCYVSYDPEAYFNPHAEVFPWRDGAGQAVPADHVPVNTPAASVPSPALVADTTAADAPKGFIPTFLSDAIRYQGYTRGKRHTFMLELGRRAARKGFSMQELEELTVKACEGMVQTDYTSEELRSDLSAGYQYVIKTGVGVMGSGATNEPWEDEKTEEDEDSMLEKSQELRAAAPCFSDEALAHLPAFLKRARAVGRTSREADFLLMGALAHLSICFPNVNIGYGHGVYAPTMFFVAVSPPATSKGVIELTKHISAPLNRYYIQQNKKAKEAYQADLQAWELERTAAQRGKTNNLRLPPEEPLYKCIHIPANSTKPFLIKCLHANGAQGAILHASEINALSSAIAADHGRQDDLLCAAAQNESYAYGTKTQGGAVSLDRIILSMCLTGTPDQFVGLVDSQANGLYSRWAALTAPAQEHFHNMAPVQDDQSALTIFKQLGEEALEMHRTLLDMPPSTITFTPQQWERHQAHFEEKLKEVILENKPEANAIVFRQGLSAMRIAAQFTMLRKCEDRIYASERVCSDEDFEMALHIVDVISEHVLLIASSLPLSGKRALPLREFHTKTPLIKKMPDTFTFMEFMRAGDKRGISRSSFKRALRKALRMNMVEIQGGIYKKIPKQRTK